MAQQMIYVTHRKNHNNHILHVFVYKHVIPSLSLPFLANADVPLTWLVQTLGCNTHVPHMVGRPPSHVFPSKSHPFSAALRQLMSLVSQTNTSVTSALQDTPNLCKWQDYMAALSQRMTRSSSPMKIWSYKMPAQLLPGVRFEYSCRVLRPITYHVFDHG